MSFLAKNKVRIFLFWSGIFGVIFAPWGAALIVMCVAAILHPAWEVLLIGLFADFVWLPATPITFPIFTIASIIMLWCFEPLRREFLIGSNQ